MLSRQVATAHVSFLSCPTLRSLDRWFYLDSSRLMVLVIRFHVKYVSVGCHGSIAVKGTQNAYCPYGHAISRLCIHEGRHNVYPKDCGCQKWREERWPSHFAPRSRGIAEARIAVADSLMCASLCDMMPVGG